MDKNKTLVDKKQYHIDKIYDAIRWNETVCDLFCVCDVRLEESGIIAESFYADIINNEMKGEVGRILKQQKCFGYTEQDSLILYLFCTRLRGFHCLESDNDADGNCRGIVGMINQMKLEQRIMLIYRLLCENLKAIRFYPLSEDVGIEVKNEHVVTDSVIDQFIRIKNEASKLKTIGRYRNEDDDKFPLIYGIVSLYTTYILEEPIHPVGTPFPGSLKVEEKDGMFYCPVKDANLESPNAVCKFSLVFSY